MALMLDFENKSMTNSLSSLNVIVPSEGVRIFEASRNNVDLPQPDGLVLIQTHHLYCNINIR